MSELTTVHWGFLVLGAIIMGLSKGGIPGAGNLTVALFVLVLEDALGPVGVGLSVGLLLPVLISADLCFHNGLSKICRVVTCQAVIALFSIRGPFGLVGI